MVIQDENRNLLRVTVTLDPEDVDLLDRLARLEGGNRSAELRGVLAQIRPVLQATVSAFETAIAQRELFDAAAARATVSQLQTLLPEAEKVQRQYLGMLAKIEGQAAAEAPASNTGATK